MREKLQVRFLPSTKSEFCFGRIRTARFFRMKGVSVPSLSINWRPQKERILLFSFSGARLLGVGPGLFVKEEPCPCGHFLLARPKKKGIEAFSFFGSCRQKVPPGHLAGDCSRSRRLTCVTHGTGLRAGRRLLVPRSGPSGLPVGALARAQQAFVVPDEKGTFFGRTPRPKALPSGPFDRASSDLHRKWPGQKATDPFFFGPLKNFLKALATSRDSHAKIFLTSRSTAKAVLRDARVVKLTRRVAFRLRQAGGYLEKGPLGQIRASAPGKRRPESVSRPL